MRRSDQLFIAALGVLSCTGVSYGMATEQVGPDSAQRFPTDAQPEWPVGLIQLARHESRVYSRWVNGSEQFHFRASPDQINELILLFSKMRIRDHELWIKERKPPVQSFAGVKIDYRVMLDVPGGIMLAKNREAETPSTHEPALTVYVDLPADQALAERMKLPDNIIVNNEVANFPLKGKVTKPKREVWYAQVQFEDLTPAVDCEHYVFTEVTFWEKDIKEGIPLGQVDHKGGFYAGFSEAEIADFRAGRSWLTLTVGNWLTEAKSDHPKLSWTSLAREKGKVQPVTVAKPSLYYGRILFEDGSPATSGPWLGSEIRVDFPYAGFARIESDGYFKVCFTGDQYEKAKAGKERKNIYVPDSRDSNKSTALFIFPVSKLSQDKQKAGVVTIPRPGSEKDR